MATKRSSKPASEDPALVGQLDTRRCKGSATFGIAPHDALVADFPVQPSRPDGLGTMCKVHWREYTSALRKASQERKGLDAKIGETSTDRAKRTREGGDGGSGAGDMTVGEHQDLVAAEEADRQEASPRRRRAKLEPTIDPALAAAERLLQDVDALPGPEHVKAVSTDAVQAAFATVARGRHGSEPEDAASA